MLLLFGFDILGTIRTLAMRRDQKIGHKTLIYSIRNVMSERKLWVYEK